MAGTMRFASHPAVSVVLLPESASHGGESLDLFVGSDYRIGKLIRSGLDAVHGLNVHGQREYEATTVRQNLPTIDHHIGAHKQQGASPRALMHQGHGNIGLNNYAVACKTNGDGSSRLILPAGEPLHERVYPCFIATDGTSAPRYGIEDVIFFVEPDGLREECIVEWDPETGAPAGAEMAPDPLPDRELLGNDVYLPIWDPALNGNPLRRREYDERIDWDGTGVRFAKVSRSASGTLEIIGLQLAKVELRHPGSEIGAPIADVRFAFFGIPVESLANPDIHVGNALATTAHYFYDLRHLIDLIGVGKPEFHLLEYALKHDGFKQARQLLKTYREGCPAPAPLVVDVEALGDLVQGHPAHSAVKKRLSDYQGDHGAQLKADLLDKGYIESSGRTAPAAGQFAIDPRGLRLEVRPRRNTYSYSFIGTVTAPDDQRYVLLAVAGGHGGLRPHGGHFTDVMATGLNLEAAVRAVYSKLAELWGSGNTDVGPHHDDRLLLLDQGGDVHQWISVGGLGYIVGSTEGRALMSGLIAVLTD